MDQKLGSKLKEYEKAVEKHLIQLENDITQRQIQLEAGIKLEITRNQSGNAIKHQIDQDIALFTKKIDEIDFNLLKNHEKKEEKIEELKSDADLVANILRNACNRALKEEDILRTTLESIKEDTKSLTAAKHGFKASDQHILTLFSKSENEIQRYTNMKLLQDLYIRRLRSDIIYGELSVGNLVGVITDIQKRQRHSFVNFSTLTTIVKKFTDPQSHSKNQWKDCLSFAIYELHLGSVKFSNNKHAEDLETEEIKTLIFLNYQTDILEKKCDDYLNRLLLLRNHVYHQKEYITALKIRYIGARIRSKSLISQILAHSDQTQEKLFEAELKTEIRKFLCKKLENFMETQVEKECKNLQETPKYSTITVQLFRPEFRASDLLNNCQKRRKNFIVKERNRAALFFRFQRLSDEVRESRRFNEKLSFHRQTLEHKLFEIESQFDPLLSLQAPDIKQIESQTNEKIKLEDMIKEMLLEREKFENESNLLNEELETIRIRCEILCQKTGSLSHFQGKNEAMKVALQKISLLLGERHELLNRQYQIQQKLKTIISRRECAFNSFANSIQNQKSSGISIFYNESVKELQFEISKLKLQIREKRENLLLNAQK